MMHQGGDMGKPLKLLIPGKPKGRPEHLGPRPVEGVESAGPRVRAVEAELVACYSLGRAGSRQLYRTAPDSTGARSLAYWLDSTRAPEAYWRDPEHTEPKGPLSVEFWSNGWGREGERHDVLAGKAPPVAGSMPAWIKVLLPDGTIHKASSTGIKGDVTYALALRPGELVTVTRPVVALPSAASRALRKRRGTGRG